MNPEPVGGITAHGNFERLVNISHDFQGLARPSLLLNRDLVSRFDSPSSQSNSVTHGGIQNAMIAQRKNSGRGGSRAVSAQEWEPEAAMAGMLIGQQPEQDAGFVHLGF